MAAQLIESLFEATMPLTSVDLSSSFSAGNDVGFEKKNPPVLTLIVEGVGCCRLPGYLGDEGWIG